MPATFSRTTRKSSPLKAEDPLLNIPGTFSQQNHLGRTDFPARPRCTSAFRISFVTRICSINSPDRAPANPARVHDPMLKSWHGLPPQMMSTGGSFAPSSLVMSPTWSMSGKWCFVTWMGKGSISLAHSGVMPCRTAASGKPPIPSNKLPIVVTCFASFLSAQAQKVTRSAAPPLPTQPASLGLRGGPFIVPLILMPPGRWCGWC